MAIQRLPRVLLAVTLIIASVVSPIARAQNQSASTDPAEKLAAIEKIIEAKRAEMGVPGVAVAIVKDDKAIFQKGFGLRDVERNLPVTADTLFAIGSCTKAFTAMAAVISQDEGKLSLDDSPKKHLPYFKLQDPEADAQITVRDLLHHSSGLDQTDISWYTGALNREEAIKVAGLAKPKAKFREKFQYQNTMYSAAGEVVGQANKTTWEAYLAERFFKPLGMKSSDMSVKQMVKAADYATGYSLEDKNAKKAMLRDLTNIAPAGAINSNVKDMSQWARLMLGGGVFEGKRFVSEKGFAEVVKKQISAFGDGGYGLGWALNKWEGHQVVSHSGGIDGFNSLVTLMPDQKLGVIVLTNVSGSALPQQIQNTVFENIVGRPESAVVAGPAAPPQSEVGKYALGALNIEVAFKDGKLRAIVPGQPEYELINVGGRRYKFGPPAPDGFFMTFRPVKESESGAEMYLEQPHGNYTLPKVWLIKNPILPVEEPHGNDTLPKAKAGAEKRVATANLPQYKELIGNYELNGETGEITTKDDKVVLVVRGRPPYTLVEKEKDAFGALELPDTYRITVKRNAAGEITGFLLKQPNGEFDVKRVSGPAPSAPTDITIDDLMAKAITAAGGEANLRKHRSMMVVTELDFENQGLTGESVDYTRAPNLSASTVTFLGLGKKIGSVREYFDGASGGSETDFTLPEVYEEKQLDDERVAGDFYEALNWKTLYKIVIIKGKSKVDSEEVYVVVKMPEKGNAVTDYISAKSFLLLKRDRATSGGGPISETYGDYRNIDGVILPFSSVTKDPSLGRVVGKVKEVRFDVDIPDATFRASAK
jgi:CubicO group peptidase (beta-lactamase class C family)